MRTQLTEGMRRRVIYLESEQALIDGVRGRSGYWVSGVKHRGSDAHPAERGVGIEVDPGALNGYRAIRAA